MGRLRALAAAGTVILAGSAVPGAFAGSADAERAAAWAASPRTVVVGYDDPAALAAALTGTGARVTRTLPALRTAEVRTRGPAERLARLLARRPGIRYAEPAALRSPQVEPALSAGADAAYEWQYAAAREDSVPPWVLRAAASITIATVDTGADLTAPDLAAKSPATYDVLKQGHDVRDLNGHGTFVASLAAGSVTNGDGMAGFGGDAQLLVVRAGSPDGAFTDVDEAAGIVYAVDHGARIVNLSLGGPSTSTTEKAAIDYAISKGALLVAAAGNERQQGNPVEYPAALVQPVDSNGVGGAGLSVGASTAGGGHAPFSNTGSYISLAAPGVDVLGAVSATSSPALFPRVAVPGAKGLYGIGSGTSFAAPEVAGAAALVWAANPALSPGDVAQLLKETASGLGAWSPDLGYGVVDVAAAVSRATGVESVLLSAVPSRNRVHLTWSGGHDAATYRVSVSQDGGPAHAALPPTTQTDVWLTVAPGHAYTFTIGAFDANGTTVAVSAPAYVRVGRAPSSLAIAATGGRRHTKHVTAVLRSSEAAVPTADLRVSLELLVAGRWRRAGSASTDVAGRATWSLSLRPGTYTIRASFSGSADLARTESRLLSLVVS